LSACVTSTNATIVADIAASVAAPNAARQPADRRHLT
jgi:hypothetical protein